MNTKSLHSKRQSADLWTATAEAARESKVLRFRPDPSPCPGDTFVFHETAEYPVEWTIVERDPSDVRRLLVVPLDDYPQIGSHDVGLHSKEPGRVAHIRCDRDVWLDASRFSTELRTGELTPENVAEIRQKREAITSGTPESSLLEEKVDGDPEYRRWKDETLKNAVSALERGQSQSSQSQPRQSRTSWGRVLALAATVVMTMSVSWSVYQNQEIEQLRDQVVTKEAEIEQTKEVHEQQRTAAARNVEELRGELDETARNLADRDQKMTELRQELAASPSTGVTPNHPVYFLADGRRGGEHPVPLRGEDRMVLVVEVIDPEPYELYGVELIERATGVKLWESDRMVRRGSALSLSLPSPLFESGYYNLLLYGIDDDGSRVLLEERYLLKTW